MENLWSTTIQNAKNKNSPLYILKVQASQLGSITKNLVRAEMRMKKTPSSSNQTILAFDFNIVASLLENYRYRLFSAGIDISENYPLVLNLPKKLIIELIGNDEEAQTKGIIINNELELLDWLRRIFGAEYTINIISSLIQTTEKGSN
ncbi:MAG: hypothetical protein M0Q13_03135 [Methanothrix sp.]|jgi:hypothetical protein|nr:hypothetical protein [Methanothrix sp.]